MKFTGLYIFFLFAFFLFAGKVAFSQSRTRVEARIDRDSIFIGQHITLSLTAEIPETEPIRFFSLDTIPHFEFIRQSSIDTVNTSYGTKLYQEVIITSFDSGQFVIPPFVLDESAGLKTDSFLIHVRFSPFNPEQDYHKVKDIIEVIPSKKQDRTWIFFVSGGVLFLLALYFLLRKKKPKPRVVVAISPFEKAMKALNDLNSAPVEPKEYYSRLTDILREYLSGSLHVQSMQKTTDDLVMQLQSLGMEKNLFNSLSQSLRLCDFVKFAKYIPAKEDGKKVFEVIKETISFFEKGKMKNY